jgi:hypothetical protein
MALPKGVKRLRHRTQNLTKESLKGNGKKIQGSFSLSQKEGISKGAYDPSFYLSSYCVGHFLDWTLATQSN